MYRQCLHCGKLVPASERSPAARCPACRKPLSNGATLTGADVARNQQCAVCNRVLHLARLVHRTCESAACQATHLRRLADDSAAKQAEQLKERASRLRDSVVDRTMDGPPEAFTLAVLPVNTWPLAPLPRARRRLFAGYLRGIIEQAFAAEDQCGTEPSSDHTHAEPTAPAAAGDDLAILGSACATCRGWCCQAGGEHAYLDPDAIRRYRADHPDQGPEEVYSSYIEYLPGVTYEGSCVYHTEAGCALPRPMRSEVARTYYCGGLKDFRHDLDGGEQRGFAVAVESGAFVRAAIIDSEGAHLKTLPPE